LEESRVGSSETSSPFSENFLVSQSPIKKLRAFKKPLLYPLQVFVIPVVNKV
jgi:hypothetical protein